MDIFFSAAMSELISRFLSFLIKKYAKQMSMEEKLQRLQQLLLRVHTVVEEAKGRHITNQQMLLQLKIFTDSLYRGCYALDAFKYGALEEEKAKYEVSHDHYSFVVSSFNSAKRLRFTTTSTAKTIIFGREAINELQIILGSLETLVEEVKVFVTLLGAYTRMFRQPYSTYLYMDNYMFGRHVERKQIINFLLQIEPLGSPNPGVLPIIGPRRVGKKTLVEHVCKDEMVQNHFSSIVLLSGDNLESKTLAALKGNGQIKNQKFIPGRSLAIIEFVRDVDADTWKRFYSSTSYMDSGSKIIILSRTEEMANWGTVHPIRLKNLSQEEYWYFFKALAFGSTDPKEHPKLAPLGMEIAMELKGSFLGANILGRLLRANLNARLWYTIMRTMKEMTQKHICLFGEHPIDLLEKNRPINLAKFAFMNASACSIYDIRATSSAQNEQPKVTSEDMLLGKTTPLKKFDVLLWKSHIPPYYNYIATFVQEKH